MTLGIHLGLGLDWNPGGNPPPPASLSIPTTQDSRLGGHAMANRGGELISFTGSPTTFTITAGDPGGLLQIDSAGSISAVTTGDLPAAFTLTVELFDGVDTVSGTVELDCPAGVITAKDFSAVRSALGRIAFLTYGTSVIETISSGIYLQDASPNDRFDMPNAIQGTHVPHNDLDLANYQGKDVNSGAFVIIRPEPGATAPVFNKIVIDDKFTGSAVGLRFTGCSFIRDISDGFDNNGFIVNTTNPLAGVGLRHLTIDNSFIGCTGFVHGLDLKIHSGISLLDGDFATVQDCTFDGVAVAIRMNGEECTVVGNVGINVWEDWTKTAGGSNYVEAWNLCYLKDNLLFSSPNEVHGDWSQWINTSTLCLNPAIVGNKYFIGKTKLEAAGQGLFWDNFGDLDRVVGFLCAGNIVIPDLLRATTFSQVDGATVRYNTMPSPYEGGFGTTTIFIDNKNPAAADNTDVLVSDNVTGAIVISETTNFETFNNDTSVVNNSPATQDALFVAPKGAGDLTPANLVSSFTPLVGGSLDVPAHKSIIGAIAPAGRTQMIDYVNRTVDFPFQETGYTPSITDLTGQTVSTAVTTSFQVTGVSATGADVYITGGNSATYEIRESNDITVIETAIPVDARRIVYANQYIHLSDTTAATGGVTTDLVVHIGANQDTWSYTTSSTVTNLLTTPDFSSSTGWLPQGGWSISGGTANRPTGGSNASLIQQSIAVTGGVEIEAYFQFDTITAQAGNYTLRLTESNGSNSGGQEQTVSLVPATPQESLRVAMTPAADCTLVELRVLPSSDTADFKIDDAVLQETQGPRLTGSAESYNPVSEAVRTLNYSAPAGTNRIAIVMGSWETTAPVSAMTVSSMLWNGVGLTHIGTYFSPDATSTHNGLTLWYMPEALIPAGAQDLVLTLSENASNGIYLSLGVFDTAAQSSPIDGLVSSLTKSVNLTTAFTNETIINCGSNGQGGASYDNQQITIERASAAAFEAFMARKNAENTGVYPLGWTDADSSREITAAFAIRNG